MRESYIQTRIKNTLEDRGWLVAKIITCSKNGWPDQQAHKHGRTVFIEVKRAGEVPSPLQLFRHKQLREQGFEVVVAYGTDDVDHLN